jgi:hypothetical protein
LRFVFHGDVVLSREGIEKQVHNITLTGKPNGVKILAFDWMPPDVYVEFCVDVDAIKGWRNQLRSQNRRSEVDDPAEEGNGEGVSCVHEGTREVRANGCMERGRR